MASVYRIDYGTVRGVERTPIGGLRVDAAITRTGVLTYRDTSGKQWNELRPDDEVFAPASIATARDVPVTDGHPSKLVTPDTFREHSRGHVGDTPKREHDLVTAPLVVDDADTARRAESGELHDVSAGYTCDLDDTPGSYGGQAYDKVQRNIRYNHVALLPRGAGRAGADVSLRMDGAAEQVDVDGGHVSAKKTIQVLGKAYRCDDDGEMDSLERDVAADKKVSGGAVDKAKADADAKAAAIEALQASAIGFVKQIAQLQAELAIATAQTPDEEEEEEEEVEPEEVLDARGARRLVARELLGSQKMKGMRADAVRKLIATTIETKAAAAATVIAKVRADALSVLDEAAIKDKSVIEIRRAVLAKISPAVKLDSLADAVIEPMFDAAVSAHATAKPPSAGRADGNAEALRALNARTDGNAKTIEEHQAAARTELMERGRRPLNGAT